MNVVDSSCWLEFVENSPIRGVVAPIVLAPKHLLVPTVVLYEVYKKLLAMRGKDYADEFIETMLTAEIVPLDTELSLNAANISREHKLAMADSIIYATALQYNAVLWTTDKHFEGLPNVRYFDKTKQ